MRAAEFGTAVGYGEDLVYKIEGGKRIPRPEYLDKADEVLGAGGLLSAMISEEGTGLGEVGGPGGRDRGLRVPQHQWAVADTRACAGFVRGSATTVLAG
jgi:hypothetical protein